MAYMGGASSVYHVTGLRQLQTHSNNFCNKSARTGALLQAAARCLAGELAANRRGAADSDLRGQTHDHSVKIQLLSETKT